VNRRIRCRSRAAGHREKGRKHSHANCGVRERVISHLIRACKYRQFPAHLHAVEKIRQHCCNIPITLIDRGFLANKRCNRVLSTEVVCLFRGYWFLVARSRWSSAVRRAFKPTVERRSPLNWNRWVRQLHRWLSIAFTLVVIFNGAAVFKHRYTNWMGLLAVAALALMFFTGMYLFVLPYLTKWRSERRAD
jgi:hypothetical protein